MSESTWTWLLFCMEIIGVTGMWFVGKKIWWGWLIIIVHTIPWFIYAVSHNKPGFIAMSLMWWAVHWRNMIRWRREQQMKEHDELL